MDRIQKILIEFQKKNYDSFDEFYDLTSRILYVVINDIVKNKSDTEDILQDTYLKILESVDSILESKYPKSYIVKIGKNKAINHYNYKKKHEMYNDEIFDYIPDEKTNERVNFSILNLLDESNKEVVKLHLIGDLTFKEIASIVDKPLGTVLWMYNKSIKYLRKEVNKDYENE